MTRPRIARGGFSLIELMVVIAIIVVLIAILLPAVNKAREAGYRTDNSNRIKQITLAALNYNDQNKVLPSYSGSVTGAGTNAAISGSGLFRLFPYMELDAVFNSTYGPFQTSSSSTTNGTTTHSNSTATYSGYQASRASGVIKMLVSLTDPTIYNVSSPASFMLNGSVFTGSLSVDKIVDGASNTIFVAEGYSDCNWKNQASATVTQIYENYTREWNYDPSNTATILTTSTSLGVTTQTYGSTTVLTNCAPYFNIGASSGSPTAVTNTSSVPQLFQIQPSPSNSSYTLPQSSTAAGLLCSLGDGSVRFVAPTVSATTFTAACSPNGGETLGSDW